MTCAATVKSGFCIGCGICRASCGAGAIRMVPSSDLVRRPVVDKSKCSGCGLCERFCPNAPVKMRAMAEDAARTRGAQPIAPSGVLARSFLCWDSANENGRRRSASGGIATALALRLLEEKKIDVVVHAKRVVSGRGEPHGAAAVSRTAAEIEAGRGSIYEPIDFSDALLSLGDGSRCFMTGTPCVVRGVKKLFAEHPRYRKMKLYTCALVCSHNVTPQFADYFADRKRIAKNARYTVNFRDKTDIKDAGNYNSCYVAEDGKVILRSNRHKNGYTALWRSYAFAVSACCKCPDFWCVDADISVKDAWGRNEWVSDPLGKSVAIVRSKEMLATFDACSLETRMLETTEAAQMQKPQIVYKLDDAEMKLKHSVFVPANIRNGHFRQMLASCLTRLAYAAFGAFATAALLKLLLHRGNSGRKSKRVK